MGCDHHTVQRYVQLRENETAAAGRLPRAKVIDALMPKVEDPASP
jgi:hypothetical protein